MTPSPCPPPAAPSKSVTVSVVSHGQIELILPLLDQLDRFCHAHIAAVVVTHNIAEECQERQRDYRFPVMTVNNSMRKGFGSNHNAAFSRCDTPWFLVLNPDVRIHHDVIAALLSLASPETGLLAPRVLEPGKSQPEAHRGLITPWEILRRHKPGYHAPAQPEWVPGLFMLFRSESFATLHGFDTRYFMYGEDADICARLRTAGWKIRIDETSNILHEAQRNSHANRQHLVWHISSLARLWLSAAFWKYIRHRRNP